MNVDIIAICDSVYFLEKSRECFFYICSICLMIPVTVCPQTVNHTDSIFVSINSCERSEQQFNREIH